MKNSSARKSKPLIAWWLYLFLAICSYLVFRYLVPAIIGNSADSSSLISLFKQAAPICTILFLLLAANGLYEGSAKPDVDNLQDKSEKDGEAP